MEFECDSHRIDGHLTFFFRLRFKHSNSFIFGEYVSPFWTKGQFKSSFESFLIALFSTEDFKTKASATCANNTLEFENKKETKR